MEPFGDLACLGHAGPWSLGELTLGLKSSCWEAEEPQLPLAGQWGGPERLHGETGISCGKV